VRIKTLKPDAPGGKFIVSMSVIDCFYRRLQAVYDELAMAACWPLVSASYGF
jgi:hypothetical protein